MGHNRSLSIVTTLSAIACVALPLALTSVFGSHAAPANFPVLKSFGTAPDFTATPISDHKAKAVQQFKLMQA
jgi:hypothetical protein